MHSEKDEWEEANACRQLRTELLAKMQQHIYSPTQRQISAQTHESLGPLVFESLQSQSVCGLAWGHTCDQATEDYWRGV